MYRSVMDKCRHLQNFIINNVDVNHTNAVKIVTYRVHGKFDFDVLACNANFDFTNYQGYISTKVKCCIFDILFFFWGGRGGGDG